MSPRKTWLCWDFYCVTTTRHQTHCKKVFVAKSTLNYTAKQTIIINLSIYVYKKLYVLGQAESQFVQLTCSHTVITGEGIQNELALFIKANSVHKLYLYKSQIILKLPAFAKLSEIEQFRAPNFTIISVVSFQFCFYLLGSFQQYKIMY